MIPVDQTRIGWPYGNCLAASVASILEVPLAIVGDLPPNDLRYPLLHEIAYSYGYDVLCVSNRGNRILAPSGYHIASGRSDRDLMHAVVYKDGILAHDPHPSRSGIHAVLRWYLFRPLQSPPLSIETCV